MISAQLQGIWTHFLIVSRQEKNCCIQGNVKKWQRRGFWRCPYLQQGFPWGGTTNPVCRIMPWGTRCTGTWEGGGATGPSLVLSRPLSVNWFFFLPVSITFLLKREQPWGSEWWKEDNLTGCSRWCSQRDSKAEMTASAEKESVTHWGSRCRITTMLTTRQWAAEGGKPLSMLQMMQDGRETRETEMTGSLEQESTRGQFH